jgi:hypothetical protein
LLALSEGPFASVRQLAHRTHRHASTVYDSLTHKLGFTVRYLRWVPHLLSEADKHTRAQFSFELSELLHHQKDKAWYNIGTLNESWFYFTTDHERIWLPEGTNARRGSGLPLSRENDGDNCLEFYKVLPDGRPSQRNEI